MENTFIVQPFILNPDAEKIRGFAQHLIDGRQENVKCTLEDLQTRRISLTSYLSILSQYLRRLEYDYKVEEAKFEHAISRSVISLKIDSKEEKISYAEAERRIRSLPEVLNGTCQLFVYDLQIDLIKDLLKHGDQMLNTYASGISISLKK